MNNKNKKSNAKRGRGRPTIPVNFNFGGKPFTIDQVLNRMNRGGAVKISRPAVYNKLMGAKGLVAQKKAKVVDHGDAEKREGRGHPTYRFLVYARYAGGTKAKKAAVTAA